MLREQKQALAALVRDAAASVLGVSGTTLPEIELDRPKQPEHGDIASNIALQLARQARRNPRELAQAIRDALLAADGGRLLDAAEVAGPGFINLRLTAGARRAVIERVLADGAAFGRGESDAADAARRILVEFVSANPTGPLHVGHGRQAALGDSLCALLAFAGWSVSREFYYNDAGAQIRNLALSVQARARSIDPDDPRFPTDGYRGDYIGDIARAYLARETAGAEDMAPVVAAGDPDDLEAIRRFAVAYLRHEQDLDLRAFGVKFDSYFLESSLYESGSVERVVAALGEAGVTYEQDGALWLRSTEYGDDKDRVMRKSGGGYTYFVPDVAYHVDKWQRGYGRAINIQGSDHHGTIARVRAGLQGLGLGIAAGFPEYVLHKMVTVMRGGQEVKISKRAGAYVTLRDLIEWSGGISSPDAAAAALAPDGPDHADALRRGRDAVRFFLVSRKADAEFVFDVDLALARNDENPVYYVQYAHARICSVLAQWLSGGGTVPAGSTPEAILADADLEPLVHPREYGLMARIAAWPEVVAAAAEDLAPHSIAYYLKDLASDLHSYYNAERVLVDDEAVRRARLALLLAVRQVLRNGLGMLGVSTPERM
ncbi:MAG: arginine--tRNA ligase [Burkholderiaceae bacterium]|nr:arginine--tRNA ligase [Burkholderiaceae bacterium]